jgi:hypothetical protein
MPAASREKARAQPGIEPATPRFSGVRPKASNGGEVPAKHWVLLPPLQEVIVRSLRSFAERSGDEWHLVSRSRDTGRRPIDPSIARSPCSMGLSPMTAPRVVATRAQSAASARLEGQAPQAHLGLLQEPAQALAGALDLRRGRRGSSQPTTRPSVRCADPSSTASSRSAANRSGASARSSASSRPRSPAACSGARCSLT